MITQQEINECTSTYKNLVDGLHYDDLLKERDILQSELEQPNMWDNQEKSTAVSRSLRNVEIKIKKIQAFIEDIENLEIAFELNDEAQVQILQKQCTIKRESLQVESFLTGRFDDQGAILSIHAGAGGLDAQDWARMISQMYQKFFTNENWEYKLISLSEGEDGGYKSVSFEVEGDFVYGYLKEEAGVHRLVRISPFNSGKTRETSFALVEVLPNNLGNSVDGLEINEKDLKWEYSMSSGKGGQSVNTTYSAVRLVHLPTGIAVTCQNERSQLQNKQQSLKYLKNKLAALELKKHKDMQNELKGGFVSAEWGSQIRSYTLHPYKLIKDHRSTWETSTISDLLEDGKLMDVIWSIKKMV